MNLVRLLESKVDFSTLTDQPLFREPGAVPYEFLTPEAMKENGLDERYRMATFDRATAIRTSTWSFLPWLRVAIARMTRPHRKSKEPWIRSTEWTWRKPFSMPETMSNEPSSFGIGMKTSS